MDSIPPSLKAHFFKDVAPPNLSKDYDAIGFDADHCLVKYNVKELTKLLVPHLLRDLHECEGWPEEIQNFDCESDDICAIQNYTCWDIKTGYLLKLGKGKEVLAAYYGRTKLSEEEIKQAYGSPTPRFHPIDFPTVTNLIDTDGSHPFITFATFFDSPKVAGIMMGVEMIKQNKVEKNFS